MSNLSVHDLRVRGFKVRVTHTRAVKLPSWGQPDYYSRYEWVHRTGDNCFSKHCLPHGGFTVVEVTSPDGTTTWKAKYNTPKGANFNRRRGITACLGRIQKEISVDGVLDLLAKIGQ